VSTTDPGGRDDSRAIRVYLVDDHTVVRQSVRVMLEAEADLVVVGEAGEGRAGVRGIAATLPAVAIIDLKMPGLPGIAAIPEILAASPRTGIIVFTMYDNASYVHEAMHAGASGYVLKSASKEELVRAVRAVHAGAGFLQAEVTKPLLRRLAADARSAGSAATLTLREIEVVELLAQGKSNKAIGHVLGIAEETVKTHLKRLYEKLGAADRAQAVAIALRQQLID
jgi:DNA-binding NarL/FixJ family response regulator